jgi:hypothetical protein
VTRLRFSRLLQECNLAGVVDVVLQESVQEKIEGNTRTEGPIAWIVGGLVERGLGQRADCGDQIPVHAIEGGDRIPPAFRSVVTSAASSRTFCMILLSRSRRPQWPRTGQPLLVPFGDET